MPRSRFSRVPVLHLPSIWWCGPGFRFRVSSFARGPLLDSVSTGLEAEALIKIYGGDLFIPVELAPMAATQPASFFRESLPTSSGIELPPDFVNSLLVRLDSERWF